MKPILSTIATLFTFLLSMSAQEASQTGLKKLAIATVKVGKAVATDAAAAGRKLKMDRMTENLNAQLLSAFQTTRKFRLVGRQNADALAEEDAATGRTFSFGDADYLLVVTVDDFQDVMETKKFAALGTTVTSRTLRFAGISEIYDARTKEVVETSNIDVERTAPEEQRGATTGDTRDSLLRELTKELAEKTAQHVADVIYPARILDKTDKTVAVNRGEGSGIANGQLWEVFALGKEMMDPDTGKSLGPVEVSVGKIRVTRVNPKFSQATVIEDTGIDQGAIVRPIKP